MEKLEFEKEKKKLEQTIDIVKQILQDELKKYIVEDESVNENDKVDVKEENIQEVEENKVDLTIKDPNLFDEMEGDPDTEFEFISMDDYLDEK